MRKGRAKLNPAVNSTFCCRAYINGPVAGKNRRKRSHDLVRGKRCQRSSSLYWAKMGSFGPRVLHVVRKHPRCEGRSDCFRFFSMDRKRSCPCVRALWCHCHFSFFLLYYPSSRYLKLRPAPFLPTNVFQKKDYDGGLEKDTYIGKKHQLLSIWYLGSLPCDNRTYTNCVMKHLIEIYR